MIIRPRHKGSLKSGSKIHLHLHFHMNHIVTAKRRYPGMPCITFLVSHRFRYIKSFKSPLNIGILVTHLQMFSQIKKDLSQLLKTRLVSSQLWLHLIQLVSAEIPIMDLCSLVRSLSCRRIQRKLYTIGGSLSFQINFQCQEGSSPVL